MEAFDFNLVIVWTASIRGCYGADRLLVIYCTSAIDMYNAAYKPMKRTPIDVAL